MLCLSLFTPGADPAPCDCPPKNVCCLECVTKKVTHPVYATKCVEYCVPHRSLLKTLCCQGDDALYCAPPRTKHLLIKKPCTEEKCVKQCVLKPAGGVPAGVDVKK